MSEDTKLSTKPDLEGIVTDLEAFVLDRVNTMDGKVNGQNASELNSLIWFGQE